MASKYDRVVVTGMGIISSIGNNVKDYWNSLINGVSGADIISNFDPSRFKTRFACQIKNFDPLQYMDKKEVRKLDEYVQFAIAAADEAMKDAELSQDNYDPERVGVIYSSGIGGFGNFTEECINYGINNRVPRFSPFFIPKAICDIGAGHLSMRYNLRGPNFAVLSACASSNNAMIEALYHLRLNKADIMVCGGGESITCEAILGGFSSMKALSERNDNPKTASRPYDKDRDGFVLGEASGILIFERLDHALKRGARIYAEVAGAGATADAYHVTAPHPEGLGAKRVIQVTLDDAGMNIEDIDYVNTHGTSTPLGDLAEVKAIKDVFGDYIKNMNISSTKSMTGHCLGGTGAIEAIACIKSITESIVPPTINHFTDDPEIDTDFNFTFNTAQKRKVRAALSNNFGFGGHNASLLFKEYIA
ncbi:MAG: beta-ketoacyl-ACP synthase II [Bacteroidetes bacterium]|nr:beta-ketoacyl-ACP synthase II [Bacteroidota bacterium]